MPNTKPENYISQSLRRTWFKIDKARDATNQAKSYSEREWDLLRNAQDKLDIYVDHARSEVIEIIWEVSEEQLLVELESTDITKMEWYHKPEQFLEKSANQYEALRNGVEIGDDRLYHLKKLKLLKRIQSEVSKLI